MPVVIEVKNLTRQFKELTAVDNLSFTINKGDVSKKCKAGNFVLT